MKITHVDPNYSWNLGNTTLSQGGGVPADTGNTGSGGGGGGGGAPSGPASGDLSGSYPGPTVVGIHGTPVDALPAVATEYLNGDGHWTTPPGGTGFVTNIDGGKEVRQVIAALGATYTLDLANGNAFDATLTADCTLTFAGATAGTFCRFTLLLRQDSTGGWTTTWPGSVIWANGAAPTLDLTASTASVLTFFSMDGGATWFGLTTGTTLNFSTTDGTTTVDPTTQLTFVGATLADLGGGNAQLTFRGGQPLMVADLDGTHWNVVVDGYGNAIMV